MLQGLALKQRPAAPVYIYFRSHLSRFADYGPGFTPSSLASTPYVYVGPKLPRLVLSGCERRHSAVCLCVWSRGGWRGRAGLHDAVCDLCTYTVCGSNVTQCTRQAVLHRTYVGRASSLRVKSLSQRPVLLVDVRLMQLNRRRRTRSALIKQQLFLV